MSLGSNGLILKTMRLDVKAMSKRYVSRLTIAYGIEEYRWLTHKTGR